MKNIHVTFLACCLFLSNQIFADLDQLIDECYFIAKTEIEAEAYEYAVGLIKMIEQADDKLDALDKTKAPMAIMLMEFEGTQFLPLIKKFHEIELELQS